MGNVKIKSCFGRHFDGISQRSHEPGRAVPALLRPPFRRHLTTGARTATSSSSCFGRHFDGISQQ